MNLVLYRRDGPARVRCEGCGKLYEPGETELKAMAREGERYECVCVACLYGREMDGKAFRRVIREAREMIARGRMA